MSYESAKLGRHETSGKDEQIQGLDLSGVSGPSARAQSAELHEILSDAGGDDAVMLKASGGGAGAEVANAVFDAAGRGSREALPHRTEMEQVFGHDLSSVEVHLGRGREMGAMGARAAARGNTVIFGESNPSRELVAHELTHVVQAKNGQVRNGGTSASKAAELEADTLASAAASGYKVSVQQKAAGGIHLASIYRGMTEAGGAPAIGPTARKLGVRVPADVEVTSDSGQQMVAPKNSDGKWQGMSTAQGSPRNLPRHRRPSAFGGTGKDPVWQTDDTTFTGTIKATNDHGQHVTVHPKSKMKLDDFQSALAATQGSWTKTPTGG